MIYITNLVKITETKYEPMLIYYQPFDSQHGVGKTREEMERDGYLLDKTYSDLLNEESQFKIENNVPDNSIVKRYFNPQTLSFSYEYEVLPPAPPSPEEEIAKLKADIDYLSIMTGVDLNV